MEKYLTKLIRIQIHIFWTSDYSQTLGRDAKIQSNAYGIREVPSFLEVTFNGPDARIYRVR